tara:strand:+ start:4812 stop:5561 length:750 start_codon:yes stop_codon:yes gene_type:complete
MTLHHGLRAAAGNASSDSDALFTSNIVTSDLRLYLNAGNSNSYSGSGTTWSDLSGNSNDTTLVHSPTYTSGTPSYFHFDGSNDYVDAASALPDAFWQGNFSFSIWLEFDTVTTSGTNYNGYAGHGGNGSLGKKMHLVQRQSDVATAIYGTSLNSSSNVTTSNWFNVVHTLNNTTKAAVIYLNGSSDASATLSRVYTGSNTNATIGRVPSAVSSNKFFDGKISRVLCYDKILTASEVTQNWNAHKADYGY